LGDVGEQRVDRRRPNHAQHLGAIRLGEGEISHRSPPIREQTPTALRPLRLAALAARRATSPALCCAVEERSVATALLHRREDDGGGGPRRAAAWWRGRKAKGSI